MLGIFNSVKRHFALCQMANFFQRVDRNPVTRTPDEADLAFEEITFESLDGLKLKAWYIPAATADKIVVFNHFMLGNRAGAVPPKDWGNVAVDFMPIYRHLVDAGYGVISYELRNHGESDVWKKGKLGLTLVEYQDSVASVRLARERSPNAELYLYSQCYGAVATIRAMEKHPKDFEGIRAFVCLQPLTPEGFVTGVTKKFGMSHKENVSYFGDRLENATGYRLEQLGVPAEAVSVPTLLVQVHDDWRTTRVSIEGIYEGLDAKQKKLLWIEGVDERLEGYNYFAERPSEMLAWLDQH